MNVISKILFSLMFLFSFSAYAKNYSVAVSEKSKLQLSAQDWVHGDGSFIPGATPMNIYSHKKKKEHHIFYEDLFIPKVALKDRLPKECLHLAQSFKGSCVTRNKEIGDSSSVSITSLFKVKKSNVLKVRSVFINGKKQDVDKILNELRGLERAPANSKKQGGQ